MLWLNNVTFEIDESLKSLKRKGKEPDRFNQEGEGIQLPIPLKVYVSDSICNNFLSKSIFYTLTFINADDDLKTGRLKVHGSYQIL